MSPIKYDDNRTAVIVPDPDEQIVISTHKTPDLVFVNSNTPSHLIRVAPSDETNGAYKVEEHFPDDNEVFPTYENVSLQTALTAATDMHAFGLITGGEQYTIIDEIDGNPGGNTFTVDTNDNGGILINTVTDHFPIHLQRDDGTEQRLRESTTQEYREYADAQYVYERKSGPAANWDSSMHGNQPLQPPVIFQSYVEEEFNVWTPRVDLSLATFVKNVNRS